MEEHPTHTNETPGGSVKWVAGPAHTKEQQMTRHIFTYMNQTYELAVHGFHVSQIKNVTIAGKPRAVMSKETKAEIKKAFWAAQREVAQ